MGTTIFPGTTAAQSISADGELVVGMGDTLNILIDRYERYSGHYRVQTDGAISHPLIGVYAAQGKTLRQVREDLIQRFSLYLKRPSLSVELIAAEQVSLLEGPPQVYLFGEVTQPGAYPLRPGMTFLQLFAQSGGAILQELKDNMGNVRSPGANIRTISIFRTNGETLRVDLERIQKTGDQSENVALLPGDTIFVPAGVQGSFSVLGQVRAPGSYPCPVDGKLTLMDALVKAGGFARNGSLKNIRIVRTTGDPQTFEVNLWDTLREGRLEMIPEIQAGDVIFVTYTPFYFWTRFVDSFRGAAITSESARLIRYFDERTGQPIGTRY